MSVTIAERIANNKEEFYNRMLDNHASKIRVAAPGIIQSFDTTTQTVSVQIALRERIQNDDLTFNWINIPLLLDVPICIPRAGGFEITMPINQGDECLVIFGDMCIDAWYSNGGVQNQIEKRRHDLSDAFAIIGVSSQPRAISNYSTQALELRTDDGNTKISIKPGQIDIKATVVNINGLNIGTHKHSAPSGGGLTGGPQ